MTERPIDDDGVAGGDANARVLTLTDGVVAIAMTLLALDLKPDLPKSASSRDLAHYFRDNAGQYVAFLIAFLLALMYWRIHHRIMDEVVRSDPVVASANTLFLLAITVLPLTTYLQGNYVTSLGTTLFAANVMLLAVSTQVLIEVTERAGLRREPMDPDTLLKTRIVLATSALITGVTAALAWIVQDKAAYGFFLFFLLDFPADFIVARRKKARNRG